jgi:uncharacterized protein GlcG (DUF336 family)
MRSGKHNTGRSATVSAVTRRALSNAGTALCLLLAAGAPSAVQGKDLKAVDRVPTVTLDAALLAAQAALADCRKRGATVAVAVVDRSGVPLVMLRDPLAGMHTPETAIRKAWTAVSFRGATTDLIGATAPNGPNGGIRHLPNVAMIGGGLMLQAAGSLVGAIGVSGAPGGDMDDDCAKAGIRAISDALELG